MCLTIRKCLIQCSVKKRTDSGEKKEQIRGEVYTWQLYNNTHKDSRTKTTRLIVVVLMVMALQFEKYFFMPF